MHKYNVGQQVLLTSKTDPNLSGHYVIAECLDGRDTDRLERTGELVKQPLYILSGLDGLWVESSLRGV